MIMGMQDFNGIGAKLERADENIHNLYSEMEGFFQECDYPVFPENDPKLRSQAIEYHKNLAIPARFSVLAGEIIHQLRSCFDHIVWHFSTGPIKNVRHVEFPVFSERPVNHDGRALYERKIQGIADPNVRDMIERKQPYNAADPLDDSLWLIHDLDILDKHRELILCVGTPSVVLPREMKVALESYQKAHPELNPARVARYFNPHGPSQPCVSFRDFGRREVEPVSEGLIRLFNYTISVTGEFREL